jgi:hypothetical protein
MKTQINSIFQLPGIITYNNISAFLSSNDHSNHKVKIAYRQLDNFRYYLLHETGTFYVVGKSEEEAVIKMYNLLKQKSII